MDTFGDRLTSEREDRGLSIQAVARSSTSIATACGLSNATTSTRCPTRP